MPSSSDSGAAHPAPSATRARTAPANRPRRLVVRTVRGLDERLGLARLGRGVIRKVFPEHWSFLLGEIALYSFVVLLLTGTVLAFFFQPSMNQTVYHGSYVPLQGQHMTEAYRSTLDISFDVRGGLLLRQIHHWAALVFVAALGVHLLRVFFTGAFRTPRELNWMVGLTMFVLAMAEGFAGYSLPDDLVSGTGVRIMQGIVLSLPIVGTYLSFFVFGGQYPGSDFVSRLYPVHILLLPALLVALVTVHLLLVFHQKHTQWAGPGRSRRNVVGKPLLPVFAASSTGLFLLTFAVLTVCGGIAQINPVWLYGPYEVTQATSGSQPDWYVGFLEGALRLMPPWTTILWGHTLSWNVLVPAVVLPGVLFTALYAYPFLDRWVTGDRREHHLCDRPRNQPVRTALGAGAVAWYTVLLLAGADDVLALTFHTSVNGIVWVLRVAFFVVPVLVFVVTKRVCLGMQRHERVLATRGEETGTVLQTVDGGYLEPHRQLEAADRYVLTAHEVPAPLAGPESVRPDAVVVPGGAVSRARVRVSRWFYRDALDRPTADDWLRTQREQEARREQDEATPDAEWRAGQHEEQAPDAEQPEGSRSRGPW